MFEKLRSHEGPVYSGLRLLRLVEEEFVPEPVFKEVNGKLFVFEEHNTFIVECKEAPFYSCVMHLEEYEDGTADVSPIYDASLIEELTEAGFGIQSESLEEARQAYADFMPDLLDEAA